MTNTNNNKKETNNRYGFKFNIALVTKNELKGTLAMKKKKVVSWTRRRKYICKIKLMVYYRLMAPIKRTLCVTNCFLKACFMYRGTMYNRNNTKTPNALKCKSPYTNPTN
jgi:hypothetical protein